MMKRTISYKLIVIVFFSLIALITQMFSVPETNAQAPHYNIIVTDYNPVLSQTDNDPCTGASGVDLCLLAKEGHNIIALSRELVGRDPRKPFHYGERVHLISKTPQCNGDFLVQDTMNARFKYRGDIFLPKKELNFGKCSAILVEYLH